LNARQTIRRLGDNSDEQSFSFQTLARTAQRNRHGGTVGTYLAWIEESLNMLQGSAIKIDMLHELIREQTVTKDTSAEVSAASYQMTQVL